MRPRKQIPSRRCSPCGNWFEPDPRAAKVQVACCGKCRTRRRNQQAKGRRAAAPEKYRAAERLRQARCREKKRTAVEGTGPPASEVEGRLEGILEQALASPPPTRAVLGQALRELVRVAALQAGT